MKFTCDRQILAKALNTVSKAVSTKTTIPILKGILLNVRNGYLTMTASDLDISIRRSIEVDIEEEGTVVVMAKLFGDIVRKLPNGAVTIEEKEEGSICIKSSSSEFTIVGLAADEFPNINDDEDNPTSKMNFNKQQFLDMISKTTFAASLDESKGIIVGVLIEIAGGCVNFVALDGFRMAVVREQLAGSEENKIIVAAKILNDIYKILAEIDAEEENIYLNINDKKAFIYMENTKIELRLLSGDFIRYNDILPKESKCKIIADRFEFAESIERAALLAKEGKNNLIKLQIAGPMLTITSRSEEGKVREDLSISHEGDDLEIGFNSKYLLDVLKVIDDEQVKLEFNTGINPCLVKPLEGNKYEYLILPVRI